MRVAANGAELYCEVRGSGPPLLCIMGATGDGGHFDRLADLLAPRFTVVTYDRRGYGRSPRPTDWAATSAEEQADDAFALLDALGLGPALVFGTSSGGTIALCLLLRHPAAVRGAILHEAVLPWLYERPQDVRGAAAALVAEARAAGSGAVLERFWRLVAGDAGWDALDPALRGRVLATADTFLFVESGALDTFAPSDDELDGIAAPVHVLVSEDGLRFQHDAARRLADRLGVPVVRTPGTHTPYHDHPEELAERIEALW